MSALTDALRSNPFYEQPTDLPSGQELRDASMRGLVAPTLGTVSDVLSALRYSKGFQAPEDTNALLTEPEIGTNKFPFGSDDIQQRMETAGLVSDKRNPVLETAAGFADPVQKVSALKGLAMGIFAGRKAKGANLEKLKMAEQMISQGGDPAYVWRVTGWGRGPDGHWRFEIPDNEMRLNLTNPQPNLTKNLAGNPVQYGDAHIGSVTDLVNHPKLFDQYNYPPDKDIMRVNIDDVYGGGGSFREASEPNGIFSKNRYLIEAGDTPSAMSTTLHELQHGIQIREGFAQGGNPSMFNVDGFEDMDSYRRLAGEAEARLTQARRGMDAWERRKYPWDEQYFEQATGVPLKSLILRGVK